MPDFSEFQQRLSEKIKTTPPVRVIVISFVLIILVGTALLMLPVFQSVNMKRKWVSVLQLQLTLSSITV